MLACAGTSAQGAQVEVTLTPHFPPPASPPPIEVTLRSDRPGREPLQAVLSGTGPRIFEANEEAWSLEVEAEGLWAPPLRFVVLSKDLQRLRVDLFEATVLQGKLEVDHGETAPAEIGVDLYPPSDEAAPAAPRPRRALDSKILTFRCPVQNGSFKCPAPAGTWDVRIGASDHVAHYFWKLPFPKGSPAVFPTLRLQKGASIAGWARAEGPMKKGSLVQVDLAPLHAASHQAAATADRALALSTKADARGFFQLTGVPPGAYVLTASLEGFGPDRFFPLRVFENRETQIEEPLVLRPPISLEIRVSPAVDLKGRPWVLEVFDLGATPGTMESKAKGAAGTDGRWQSPALSTGQFRVQLSDADRTIWQAQEVELSDPLSQIDFDLDFVEIDGKLLLGGEPVAATLYFGGRSGAPSLRFDSDAEGRFGGYLSREGTWRVEIQARNPPVRRSLPRVEVHRAPGKNVARVSIDLPGGTLQGRAIDEQGRAVAGAMILAEVAGEPPVFFETTDNGEFETHGLARGQVFVEARTRDLQADGVWVDLDPEVPAPPLELVLRKTRDVRGWVLGPFGGVPGAQVIATTPSGNQSQAVTDLAGRFSFRAPADASAFDVVVLPPGYTFQARRLSLGEEADLRLFVEPRGGTLHLEGLDDPEAGSAVLLYHDGVPVYVQSTLRRWSEGNGQKWLDSGARTAPQLQAGEYQVCRVSPLQMSAVRGAQAPGRCAGGFLPPGGELTLRVPRMN